MDSYIINNIISQLCFFIVFLFIIGFIISLLNRCFYKLTNYNRGILYATSIIGTPIHELSHAVMCLIFMHKIEEIKLFQISNDGILGYVNHSYNKKNIWALIGNFFIGIAPILCGSLVLFFLIKCFMPSVYYEITLYADDLAILQGRDLSLSIFTYLLATAWGFVICIFSEFTVGSIIFIIVGMCIALHMNLSSADLKNALPSLPFIIIIIVLLNVVLGSISTSIYEVFLNTMNIIGGFLVAILIFSIIISIGYIIVAFIIKSIIKVIRR